MVLQQSQIQFPAELVNAASAISCCMVQIVALDIKCSFIYFKKVRDSRIVKNPAVPSVPS